MLSFFRKQEERYVDMLQIIRKTEATFIQREMQMVLGTDKKKNFRSMALYLSDFFRARLFSVGAFYL